MDRHPLTGMQPPITMGHEVSGIVREIGSSVSLVKVDDRICFYPVLSCRKCAACLNGDYHFCEQIGFIGTNLDGGFAEFVRIPEYSCIVVPNGVSAEEASLIEPAAMVVRAVTRIGIHKNDYVAVVGCGPIGLITVQAAKLYGADKVVAIDTVDKRLDLARVLGADAVINVKHTDSVRQIKQAFGGDLAAVVFECVGSGQAMELCSNIVNPGGRIMVMGINPVPFKLDMLSLVNKEITLMGNMGGGGYFEKTLQHVASGELDLKKLISARIMLEMFVPQMETILSNRTDFLKVLVSPRGKL